MGAHEVLGVNVPNNESPAGGIGFVIFGQPGTQKNVVINSISVDALSDDSIVTPFPVPVVISSPATVAPAPVIAPPPIVPAPAPAAAQTATTTKALPYSINIFSESQGWKNAWGNISIATDSLTISSDNADTGAGIILGGGDGWTNYIFTATVDWIKGQTFSLMARYSSGSNYVMCSFDDEGNVSIFRTSDGQQQLIGQGAVANFSTQNPAQSPVVQASIEVRDTHVQCGLNGGMVPDNLYSGMSQELMSGGIGFTVWDPDDGNSQISVTNISVTRNAGE
jgi:hypothetical protein